MRLFVLVALGALLGCSESAIEDGQGDTFASDHGKEDGAAAADGAGVLELVNVVNASVLTNEVGLSTRVSLAIASHRGGADGVLETADDDPFDNLAELDGVENVGDGVYAALLAYASEHGYRHAETVGTLSASKLGLHVMGDASDAAAIEMIDACPRVAKWVLPSNGATQAIARYRSHCPGGAVVVRVFVPRTVSYLITDDPTASAADFWSRVRDGLTGLTPADVDWLEGPNELNNVPNWFSDMDTATWFSQFWSSLADLMHEAGYRPLVGSIPPRAARGPLTMSEAFMPTATALKSKPYEWGWSYHTYSNTLSQDAAVETYVLGYRAIRNDCGLRGYPIVLSEGGGLVLTSTGPSGWKAGTMSGLDYLSWLQWFDARMNEDPAVVGLALYQLGNHGDWDTYDVSPIAARLARYLRATSK